MSYHVVEAPGDEDEREDKKDGKFRRVGRRGGLLEVHHVGQHSTNCEKAIAAIEKMRSHLNLDDAKTSSSGDATEERGTSSFVDVIERVKAVMTETKIFRPISRGSFDDNPTAVSFSPDGNFVASEDSYGTLKIRDTATGETPKTLKTLRDRDEIHRISLAFSPDGKTVASGGYGGTVELWDVETEKLAATMNDHDCRVWVVAFSPDGKRVASGGDTGPVTIWDVETGDRVASLMHSYEVQSVAFSPDGKRIASGGYGGTVELWDVEYERRVALRRGDDIFTALSVAFSPDGKRIASGNSDGSVNIWNVETGKLAATLNTNDWPLAGINWQVFSVAFSPDGKRVASGGLDETVKIWDVETGERTQTLGHGGPVREVAFIATSGGTRVASYSKDRMRREFTIWGEHVPSLSGRDATDPSRAINAGDDPVGSLAFSTRNARYLTVTCPDAIGTIGELREMFDRESGSEKEHRSDRIGSYDDVVDTVESLIEDAKRWHREDTYEFETNARSVSFSPDWKRIVSGETDEKNTAKIRDANTGEWVATLEGHENLVTAVAFSPDGERVVTGSHDETARIWNANTAECVATLEGHEDLVTAVAFSPDGKRVATGSHDATARIWNANTGEWVATLEGHADSVLSVAFSPDGERVVTGSYDETARIWNANTAECVATLEGHVHSVRSVAFSPDGKFVASGDNNGTVKIWNAETGEWRARTLPCPIDTVAFSPDGTFGSVRSVAFSPDGKFVASGDNNGTVKIWNAETGERRAQTLAWHTSPIDAVAFGPDGTFASASNSNVVFWRRYARSLEGAESTTE